LHENLLTTIIHITLYIAGWIISTIILAQY